MIDCKQLPIPKYKIGDKVWIVDYNIIKECEISEVSIKGIWFDNGYTSRHDFEVKYELSNSWGNRQEKFLYGSKRTAQRILQKQKEKERENIIQTMKDDYKRLQLRLKRYDLKLEDL